MTNETIQLLNKALDRLAVFEQFIDCNNLQQDLLDFIDYRYFDKNEEVAKIIVECIYDINNA